MIGGDVAADESGENCWLDNGSLQSVVDDEKWALLTEYELFKSRFFIFLLNGKHPFDSSTGGQSNLKSGGKVLFGPKTLSSL